MVNFKQLWTVACCALAIATASCTSADDGSSPAETGRPSQTIDLARRPPVPPAEVVAERLNQLPFEPGLRSAIESSTDWEGTLRGFLYRRLPDGEWRLCMEILESYPEQCGSHVVLSSEPAARFDTQFDVQYDIDTSVPVVEVGEPVEIAGVLLHDSLLFVPDS